MSIEAIEGCVESQTAIESKFKPNLEKIIEIYKNLKSFPRTLSLDEYSERQQELALSDENKNEAALAYHKDAGLVAPDEAMMYYSLSGKSEEYAINNLYKRQEPTIEYLKKYYEKYIPKEILDKLKEEQI